MSNPTLEEMELALYRNLTGWGNYDIQTAMGWLRDAGLEYKADEFADYITGIANEREDGSDLRFIDVCECAMMFIVDNVEGTAELKDSLYANACATDFDIEPSDAGVILAKVSDHNQAWQFLVGFTNAMLPGDVVVGSPEWKKVA